MTEIEAIARLDVKPGETLVLRVPESMGERDAEDAGRRAKELVPDGVKIMVLHGDIELSVLSAGEDS